MEKELGEKMIQVCQCLVRALESALQGVRSLSEKGLVEAEEARNTFRSSSSELTQLLVKMGSPTVLREWMKPYLSIATSFDRMGYNLDGILDRLRKMVQEQILFTDRGVKEVSDVFQETIQLLDNLPDLILTQNRLLADRLREKGKSIFKMTDGYSEEHEMRLIEGTCVPKASPIYLGFLESLKGIVVHFLEISQRTVSLSAKA